MPHRVCQLLENIFPRGLCGCIPQCRACIIPRAKKIIENTKIRKSIAIATFIQAFIRRNTFLICIKINTLCDQIIIDENELYVLLRFFLILISDFLDYSLSPFEVYFDEICFEFRSFFGNSFHRILLS